MTITPTSVKEYTSAYVSAFSKEGFGGNLRSRATAAPASAVWDTTNRIHFLPVVVPSLCTVYRFFWLNGSVVGTNNLQAGIYYDGTDGPTDSYLLGTSTLSAGANICQYDNVTDTAIPAGRWWIALWCNGTTATVFRGAQSNSQPYYGFWETNAGGLPANATPTVAASTYQPVFGFTTVSSP